ncbi:DUF4071 domain-containing protein [Cytophagaceae bacterium SJW1-29]|uniref:DUF4071 domain-containing protein n=2 Tax=Salmonirosea aquatica TaxID=2654236 RepID=A0A7C9FZJ0_9BACT|nr:DUF4071 domain-containing protein [Cytophagaceae bacterium SJW1-29]
MNEPLCFVLMPFGNKTDSSGNTFNFDKIYKILIEPAIEKAGFDSIRADEEMGGGIIHKPMLERLILCEFAIADLTTANANVFYELGLRHAVRPWSTILLYAEGARLPFDVAPLRAYPYKVDSSGRPSNVDGDIDQIVKLLIYAKKESKNHENVKFTDSPLYQLVEDYPNIDHTKTDVFREKVTYSKEKKKQLFDARNLESVSGTEKTQIIKEIENEAGSIEDLEAGVVIDLLLSYRAVKAWREMIRLVLIMPRPLVDTVLVQEQYAFALNRNSQSKDAERVLLALIERRGPSSETLGLLGRVYKDRWQQAAEAGDDILAEGLLDKAVDAYAKGFETDWRDAYPGVNAVTLMSLKKFPDDKLQKILPIVQYSVERRIESGKPDYWDYATLVELAVLNNDEYQAGVYLGKALASIREIWEPETTARNLRLIITGKQKKGVDTGWIEKIETVLLKHSITK